MKKYIKNKLLVSMLVIAPLNVNAGMPTFGLEAILTELEGLIKDNMDNAMNDWVETTAQAGVDAVNDDLKNCFSMDALFGPLAQLGGGEIELPCGGTFGVGNPLDQLAQGLASDLNGLYMSIGNGLINDIMDLSFLKDSYCALKKLSYEESGKQDSGNQNKEINKKGCRSLLTYWKTSKSSRILDFIYDDKPANSIKDLESYYYSSMKHTSGNGSALTKKLNKFAFYSLIDNPSGVTGFSNSNMADNAIKWQFYLFDQCESMKSPAYFMKCINLNFTNKDGVKEYLSKDGAVDISSGIKEITPSSMYCLNDGKENVSNELYKLNKESKGESTICDDEPVLEENKNSLQMCYDKAKLSSIDAGNTFSPLNIKYNEQMSICLSEYLKINEKIEVKTPKPELDGDNGDKDAPEKPKDGKVDDDINKPDTSSVEDSAKEHNENSLETAGTGNTSNKNITEKRISKTLKVFSDEEIKIAKKYQAHLNTHFEDVENFNYPPLLKNINKKVNEGIFKTAMKTQIAFPFSYASKNEESGGKDGRSYTVDSATPSMGLVWFSPLDVIDSFVGTDSLYHSNNYKHSGFEKLAKTSITGKKTEVYKFLNGEENALKTGTEKIFETMQKQQTKLMVQKTSDFQASDDNKNLSKENNLGVVMKKFNYAGSGELLYKQTMNILSVVKPGGGGNSYIVKGEIQWKASFMAQIMMIDLLDKILQNQVRENYKANMPEDNVKTDILINDNLIEIMKKLDDTNNNLK